MWVRGQFRPQPAGSLLTLFILPREMREGAGVGRGMGEGRWGGLGRKPKGVPRESEGKGQGHRGSEGTERAL